MSITVGEICAGYGGIGLGLGMLGETRTAWVADIEPGPRAVLAHRFPGVPNIGDITSVDWGRVEPVDVIAGGTPCQDMSTAGLRAGMRAGTRSGLWASMLAAIDAIRPHIVIWENVSGALSAPAYSKMESGPGCVGGRSGGPVLRAAGRVLGDLASLGYDAQWVVVHACDVGAPHQRARVFVLAHPQGQPWCLPDGDGPAPAHSYGLGWEGAGGSRHRWGGPGDSGGEPVSLLPTPAVNDMGAAYTPEEFDAWAGRQKAADGRRAVHGRSLSVEARRHAAAFGPYAPAVARWAQVAGRDVPDPTEAGRSGPVLSARFVEWMMGLPDGWVTGVPGVTRTRALRLLGNGVVPQQAAHALRLLSTVSRAGAVAA